MSCIVLIVVAAITLAAVRCAKLPPTFKRCRFFEPNFNKCLMPAIEDALPQLATNGNPKIGCPPLEPLVINQINIDKGNSNSPVNIKMRFNNLKLFGCTKSKLTNLNLTRIGNRHHLTYDATIPQLNMESNYRIYGKVLLLPVNGKGPCTVNLTNMKTHHEMLGVEYEEKGQIHVKYETYTVKFEPEEIRFDFANLFKGNEAVSKKVNQVFNDESKAVFVEIQHAFEQAFAELFKGIFNSINSRIALQDMYIFD